MPEEKATVLDFNDLSEPAKPSLREDVQGLLDDPDNEITQARIAKEVGVSNATLSQYLKGIYPGDTQRVETKLSQWLEARKVKADIAKRIPAIPAFVKTLTATKIIFALQFGHHGALVIITGPPGTSKTTVAKKYTEDNPNVWLSVMSPTKKGVTGALEEIAITIGIRSYMLRAASLERAITKRLEGTQGLLIIDEADHLGSAALETIRAIREATGIGIVLIGNEEVYSRMTGGYRIATFARLYARIGKRVQLKRPLKEDLMAIAEAFGMTGDKEHKFAIEIGQKPGGLHGLIETLRLAAFLSGGQKITLTYLRMAWNDLTGN